MRILPLLPEADMRENQNNEWRHQREENNFKFCVVWKGDSVLNVIGQLHWGTGELQM
jgi:hypothetical protein